MAAKKLPAKKMVAPSKPKEKPHGFNQTLPSVVEKKKAAERAGVLASDKKILAEAAKLNQRYRAQDKKDNLGFGLINVTYRDKSGKLKNSVENRAPGTTFPKDDVVYLYNKDKPKKKK